jgi:hypothetical protein
MNSFVLRGCAMRYSKLHRRTCRLTSALAALAVAVGSLVGVLPRSAESHNGASIDAAGSTPRVVRIEQDNFPSDRSLLASKPNEREVAARPEHRPGMGGRLKPLKSIAVRTFEGDKRVVETRCSHVARSILPDFSPLATIRLLI